MDKTTRRFITATVAILIVVVALPTLAPRRATVSVAPAVVEQTIPAPPPVAAKPVVPPPPVQTLEVQAPKVQEPVVQTPMPAPTAPPVQKKESARTTRRTARSAAPSVPAAPARSSGVIENAFRNHAGNLPVTESGVVSRVLPDDNQGSRHQRFIVTLASGHTVLIAHNLDIAPRINDLRVGDQIVFSGIYEWNDKGGVVHWTHHDPSGQYGGGYLQHNGMAYQ